MTEVSLIEKAVQWAKKHGFKEIKANIEEFEKPTQYTLQGRDQPFVPDVTALQFGAKSFFEIAMKTEDVQNRVSKWKLLSTLASRKGGKLYLLAPKGHKAFTTDLVAIHNIDAEVIYLKN